MAHTKFHDNSRWRAFWWGMLFLLLATGARAHPHIFIDGGVVFVFQDDDRLNGIIVTWRYDPFESLFMLSDMGVVPVTGSGFTEDERRIVETALSEFPSDFDGSAHLSVADEAIMLDWPRDLKARMVGDQLEVSFTRDLLSPLSVGKAPILVEFYEKTYFFAFNLTDDPDFIGDKGRCSGSIDKFLMSAETESLSDTLALLSREETPQDNNVGIKFADRLEVRCNAD